MRIKNNSRITQITYGRITGHKYTFEPGQIKSELTDGDVPVRGVLATVAGEVKPAPKQESKPLIDTGDTVEVSEEVKEKSKGKGK